MNFIFDLSEKFDILSTLSESDKCVILNARSRVNGEQVVIRVIYNAVAGILKSLPQIRNPYVTQVLEVIQDESDVIVIEKFIDGMTMRQFLDKGGQLAETEIYSIFIQLCQALSVIHRKSIIHRDIKPSNIMIHNGTVILIDFDVARQHNPKQSTDTVYMGTKGYAAPEQYGFAQTDSRSDIYSLGIVIKELLGDHFDKAVFRSIIEKCTQFDPLNRYQSADEVLENLRFSMTNTPITKFWLQTSAIRKHIGIVLKIIGYITMGIFCAVALQRLPHEVTVTDYILSKLVYLEVMVFLFAPFLNLFNIRNWFPFLNHNKLYGKISGVIIYIFAYILLIVVTNLLAQTFYSEQAKALLSV